MSCLTWLPFLRIFPSPESALFPNTWLFFHLGKFCHNLHVTVNNLSSFLSFFSSHLKSSSEIIKPFWQNYTQIFVSLLYVSISIFSSLVHFQIKAGHPIPHTFEDMT